MTRAYLSQLPIATLSAATEIRGSQTTVISDHTLLVPPNVDLRPDSEVIDSDGTVYRVNGSVATRRGFGRPLFKACALLHISDLEVS